MLKPFLTLLVIILFTGCIGQDNGANQKETTRSSKSKSEFLVSNPQYWEKAEFTTVNDYNGNRNIRRYAIFDQSKTDIDPFMHLNCAWFTGKINPDPHQWECYYIYDDLVFYVENAGMLSLWGTFQKHFDTTITCRSISTGKPIWEKPFKGFCSYYIDDISKSLYISTFSNNSYLTFRIEPTNGAETMKYPNIARIYQTDGNYFIGQEIKKPKQAQDVVGQLSWGKIIASKVAEKDFIYNDKKTIKPSFLDDNKKTRYWDYSTGIPKQVQDELLYYKNMLIRHDYTVVTAYDSKTFKELWQFIPPRGEISYAVPLRIVNDRIFLYSLHENHFCFMLDLKGKCLGKFENVVDINNDLVIQRISSQGQNISYFATNYITNQKMKPFTPTGMSDLIYCSGGLVFISSESLGLHVYDAKTLKLKFIFKKENVFPSYISISSHPIVTDKWIILAIRNDYSISIVFLDKFYGQVINNIGFSNQYYNLYEFGDYPDNFPVSDLFRNNHTYLYKDTFVVATRQGVLIYKSELPLVTINPEIRVIDDFDYRRNGNIHNNNQGQDIILTNNSGKRITFVFSIVLSPTDFPIINPFSSQVFSLDHLESKTIKHTLSKHKDMRNSHDGGLDGVIMIKGDDRLDCLLYRTNFDPGGE